jgi:TM2 domain-containing membrane protein YozV
MYYLWLNDAQAGPYTINQLRGMWQAGQITAQTLYFTEGMTDWAALAAIAAMLEESKSTAPAVTVNNTDSTAKLIMFEAQKKSPALACVLNFFFPGIGYMYCGKVVLGLIVFLLINAVVTLLAFFTLGLVLLVYIPVVVIDGYRCANQANKKLAAQMLK